MRLLFLFLFVNMLSGDVNAPQTVPNKKTEELFAIDINSPTPTVKAGAQVRLTVRLTNTHDRKINLGTESFVHGEVDARFQYDCRDAAGRSVSRNYPNLGSMGDRPMIILKPGESHKEEINLLTACDLSKPGQYQIQLSRALPEDPQQQMVKSNKITVNVSP